MHPARLFLVCGLPGSGKTARARVLEERFRAIRLSADDRLERLAIDIWDEDARADIEHAQREQALVLLRGGTNVVIEWGLWLRPERADLLAGARRAGALVHLEFLDAPVDVLWDRVRTRAREQTVGSRAIERADLEQWSSEIERPSPEEWETFDPMPPVVAGEQPGSPAYPYGTWVP